MHTMSSWVASDPLAQDQISIPRTFIEKLRTMNATAEMQWRSPRYIHRHAVPRGRSRVSQLVDSR
jgi:hypothetical protein